MAGYAVPGRAEELSDELVARWTEEAALVEKAFSGARATPRNHSRQPDLPKG